MGTAKWIYCPKCQQIKNNSNQRARHLDAEPIIQRISYLIDYRLIFITYHHIPYDWQANKNGGTNLPPLPLI